jgi:hypothetical protein
MFFYILIWLPSLKHVFPFSAPLQPTEQATFNQIGEVRLTVRRTSPFYIFFCLQHQISKKDDIRARV